MVGEGSLTLRSLTAPLPSLTNSFPVIIRVPFKINCRVLFGESQVEVRLKLQQDGD